MVAGPEGLQHGGGPAHAGGKGCARRTAFQRGQRRFEQMARRVVLAAVYVAVRIGTIRRALERCGEVEGRDDGAGGGVGRATGLGQKRFDVGHGRLFSSRVTCALRRPAYGRLLKNYLWGANAPAGRPLRCAASPWLTLQLLRNS